MTRATARRLTWAIFCVNTALLVAGLGFLPANLSTSTQTDWGVSGGPLAGSLFALGMFSFSIVGALVASRHPRNSVGWILLGTGFVWQLTFALDAYVTYGLLSNPGSLPRPDIALVADNWLWIPGMGLIGTFLVLLFPDGHLPSRRWRPVAWLSAGSMFLAALGTIFGMRDFGDVGHPNVRNPVFNESVEDVFGAFAGAIILIPICIAASAIALILRYRRSRGQERLQLKWFAASVAAAASSYAIAMGVSMPLFIAGETDLPLWVRLLQEISLYSFVLVPIAVGIAILKYRLYSIDRILNRTLVYGALTIILASTYLGAVTFLQQALQPLITGESDVAVAASTLLIAALFGPARRRVQGFIDRRFFRQKYDATRTLAAFSSRLRTKVELDTMSQDLLGIVAETMQPASASLWLRPAEPRPVER